MDATLLIIVIIIITVSFVHSRKTKLGHAKKQKEMHKAKKKSGSEKDDMTYGQVQQQKIQLLESVETHLADKPEQVEQLKQIINDWAELKIQAFTNRRSWVRNPGKDKD